MARMGVNEVLPGSLYQRGHFLTWTHAQKHEFLEDLGVDVVVNLWGRVDPDLSSNGHDIYYVVQPVSSRSVGLEEEALVSMIGALMFAGHRVLVHCEAGVNRSAWLCARLVALRNHITAPEAWDIVKKAVPSARLRPELARDLGVKS